MSTRTATCGLFVLGALAGGCTHTADEPSESKRSDTRAARVYTARTNVEWRNRLLRFYLRDMDRSLRILNSLSHPQVEAYLYTGHPDTIETINAALDDLSRCSTNLARAGRPPAGKRPLTRAYALFGRACREYEVLAGLLREGIPLITSESASDREKGARAFARVPHTSKRSAHRYGEALRILDETGVLPQATPS